MSKQAPTTFGDRMKAARNETGMSQVEAAYASREYLPSPMWFSHGIIQRLENGSISEEHADSFLVVVLAHVYSCSVSSLSELAAEGLTKLREVVESSLPWIATPECVGQLDLLTAA